MAVQEAVAVVLPLQAEAPGSRHRESDGLSCAGLPYSTSCIECAGRCLLRLAIQVGLGWMLGRVGVGVRLLEAGRVGGPSRRAEVAVG